MASTSETGHAKNVANLKAINSFCTGYGADYNPSKVAIQLTELDILYNNANISIGNVTAAATQFINTTNARQIIFDTIKPLATRIVNALSATSATKELIEDAKTINRKIQGSRKGGKPTPPPDAPPAPGGQVSVSQQSYDSILDNFKKLISLVASEPTYTPNEVPLQVATLNTLASDMETSNTAVVDAATQISNSRIQRNQILYKEKTGLYDIVQDVKQYVKSLFGATSPQYKQLSKIKFTKPVK